MAKKAMGVFLGANFQVHIWYRAERAIYGLVICNHILPRPAQVSQRPLVEAEAEFSCKTGQAESWTGHLQILCLKSWKFSNF